MVELVAVAADWTAVQWVAKPLLAPLLIWYLARADLVAVALGFAVAGDVALLIPGDVPFLVGMLCFLGTQLCLIVAFTRWTRERRNQPPEGPAPAGDRASGRPERWAFGGYLLVWAVANLVLGARLGDLRVPVLVYSFALSVMAATAAGVSRRTAAGGALFLVSDFLIGLEAADVAVPGQPVVIMATYSAALFLLATGWADRNRARLPGCSRARGRPHVN